MYCRLLAALHLAYRIAVKVKPKYSHEGTKNSKKSKKAHCDCLKKTLFTAVFMPTVLLSNFEGKSKVLCCKVI